MIFKVKHEKLGGHIHCALFAAKQPNMTYAKCGDFCVREEELADLQLAMSGVAFEEIEKQQERPETSIWLCGITGCTLPATHTWSGHPTCDFHATPTRKARA